MDDRESSMSERTMTRADLAEAVYQEVGLSRNESADLVEVLLNEISNTLIAGNNVKISSFGSFRQRSVAQPGSAPAWGAGGRRFKSCRSDQLRNLFL
jgi:nucleoid DNA-binding protein